ncbi:MAG TPA: putative toxin-antitoxin system toxin component, PIN family [Gemmatimonadaceae bacterium]|nr:putative toxin-antitoxin system toxin component, PIN family [Gemmatimonadaceae bacterium]
MRIVLDTNVVVSGLLSAVSPPGRVVESVFAGELVLLYDERILDEYADVLARPRFRFDPGDIGWFLTVVRLGEPVVAPPLPLTVPDPDDLKFVEVAVAGGADAIVTGNARDFKLAEGKLAVPVVSPRRFIEMLRKG